ncbi:uncharacterized protein LOC131881156 [Tigriopus californicus]|uniref:uncharacterized protein LOC131881156 n=1 Tax=Tigriopus californicus TaxID=6832 RepID=UPI0027DA26A7|nr:uncharacterized protein LOC131881156 [Tigriopus californicus]
MAGREKYKVSWEQEFQWLSTAPTDDSSSWCKVCKKKLMNKKSVLVGHSKTTEHVERIKAVDKTPKLQSLFKSKQNKDEVRNAEIQLAASVCCHTSIRAIDHIGEMMQKHGKGSIFEELRLHRTKCSRIIDRVLSPSLKEELKEDMVGARFSVLADESTDISVDKNLCLVVIYFSMKTEKIEVAYLGLYQVIEATGEALFKVIETALLDMDLQWTNCVGFGSDGASNMVGIHNSVWSRIKEKAPNCTLFKCICHSLALCVKIAFDTLPSNLGYILSEVSSWFSNSTLRRENYKALYDAIGDLDAEEGEITTNLMPFLKVSTTRWLVRGRLISAIVLHWCTLKEYFLTAEQLSDQSARMKARFIKEMLCDDNNYLFFIFLEPIVKEVERVNAFFQSSKADPEQMVKELDLLHRSIKIRVKDANGTNLSLSRVDFGGAFMTMLMSLVRERGPRGDALQQSVYQNVKTRAQTFIETLLIQLEASMPVSQ